MAKLEFYIGNAKKHIAVVTDAAVPRKGEFVNIRKETFIVQRVTWAVDDAADVMNSKLRANVVLQRVK